MSPVPVLSFDPGAITGFAALDEEGRVLFTRALTFGELEPFARFCDLAVSGSYEIGTPLEVVIESGPQFQHNSPLTRRAEAMLVGLFPEAHLVQPSQWKNHPAAQCKDVYRYATMHEKDAARLARWFQAKEKHGKIKRTDESARADSKRS